MFGGTQCIKRYEGGGDRGEVSRVFFFLVDMNSNYYSN